MTSTAPEQPDFGPRGYLPERAARRARKIVLREQLGLGWVVGAAVAALAVLAAGTVFVLTRSGPPAAPFEPVASLAEVQPGGTAVVSSTAGDVLVVRAASNVRAFVAPPLAVAYCPETGYLEGADGTVWDLTGRALDGRGAALAALPARVHGGTVYADPSSPIQPDARTADTGPPPPRCATR